MSDNVAILSYRGEHHRRHFAPVSIVYHQIFLRDFLLFLQNLVHCSGSLRRLSSLRVRVVVPSTTLLRFLTRTLLLLLTLFGLFLFQSERPRGFVSEFRLRQVVENSLDARPKEPEAVYT